MAMRGLEGEVLLNSLRHLIFSFEPYIREAGSPEQAEETLLHLEENDENFHKLVLPMTISLSVSVSVCLSVCLSVSVCLSLIKNIITLLQ